MDFIIDNSLTINSNIISGLSDNIVYNSILLSSSNNLQSNIINTSNYASNISNVLLINYNSLNTTTSNYASNISNILTIRDATNLINSSNYASNISNVLTIRDATNLINSSNYASNISNVIIINSSNYASNISNVLLNTIPINICSNLNLYSEKKYPPKLYNSNTNIEVLASYLSQNNIYKSTITLDTNNISYGSGTYDIYLSSINQSSINYTGAGNSINVVSNDAAFNYISFITSGTLNLSSSLTNCDILVIGGGGAGSSGGFTGGNGGGAGAVVYITNVTISAGNYTVTIGNGGQGMSTYTGTSINNGGDSYFGNVKAAGGGGGSAANGGSGGGSGGLSVPLSSSLGSYSSGAIYGNNGSAIGNNYGSGGGGGAGSVGNSKISDTIAGAGGAGIQINITGTNTYYGGGGGGCNGNGSGGAGGAGGGAAGKGSSGGTGNSGAANTGGGGGATYGASTGGAGGSGIVIIKYAINNNNNILLLNNNISNDIIPFKFNNYNSSGSYIATPANYIISGYNGDWIIIKFTNIISLSRIIIYINSLYINYAPSLWKFYGSINGTTYTEIQELSNNITPLTINDYFGNKYQIIVSNILTAYLYYGIVIKNIVGNGTALHIANLQFYARDKNINNDNSILTGSTINASSTLQENGTNLSLKYLQLSGGTLTGTLTGTTINATSVLINNINVSNSIINTSNYASNISNILLSAIGTNINSSNYASNISNVLLTNINTNFLKLDGTNTMTGQIITNSIIGGNLITLNTTSTNSTSAISFKNNLPIFGYLGLGCSANTNYASNLFLETTYDIMINSGGYSTTPKMLIKSNGNIGIGTTDTGENILQIGRGGRLKIGNGVNSFTMIGTEDYDAYETNWASTNTKIMLNSVSSGFATGSIIYNAPSSSGRHIFYTNGGWSLVIASDGTVRSGNDITIFDRSGNLYNNGVLIDTKYATKDTDIINTSNYAFNISNILLSAIGTGTNTNSSNYASNISNILTIRDATNLLNSSNYASNISNILRTAINSISTTNLIFNSPLLNSANTITFNESAVSTLTNFYNKTGSDARYLQLSGGVVAGTLKTVNEFQVGDTAYQLLLKNPTASTAGYIQTIQQSVGYNQNLAIQAAGGNVGIGTSTNINSKLVVYGTTQIQPKISLTGIEFFQGTNTNADGIALLLGVNRTNNRQLWIADTANLTANTTNPVIRFTIAPNNCSIDALATDGATRLPLSFGGGALTFNTNGRPLLNKMLLTNALPADTKASIESLIFNEGGIISGVFGGDSILTGYWGVAVNLNYGGATNGSGGGNNTQSYVPGWSAFTVNMRSSTSQTTFDRRLFTIMPDGNITTLGNIDCGGGLAITGSTGFHSNSDVNAENLTNTYINFKTAGANNDWCYLRQIGGSEAYKLALDFHNDANDARFCIRSITSTANPDTIVEVFTVDNGNVTTTGDLTINKTNANIQLGTTNGNNWAIPSTNGFFSTSAVANDMVLRSINNLILQSGGTGHAIEIDTTNNVDFRVGLISPLINLTTSATGNNVLNIRSSVTNANNAIRIQNNSNNSAFIGLGGSALGNYANNFYIESSNGSIILNTQGSTSTSTPNFIINTSGNIGIGTLNPGSYKLNVNGSLNSTSFSLNGTLMDFSSYATNTAITNTSNYASNISNVLLTNMNVNYLLKSGGTLSGPLTTPNITLGGTTGRINVVDDYHYIEFSQGPDITTIQEYGTIKFNIGQTKTTKAYINSSGLTATAFSGDGANITNVPYSAITDKPTYSLPLNSNATTNTISISLSDYYNQTQVNTAITNTSNYSLNISNILKTNIDTKQNTLTASTVLSGIGSNLTLINAESISSGILPVSRGGIGTTTLPNNKLLLGNTTSIKSSSLLMYDTVNNRLGVNTLSAAYTIDINGTARIFGGTQIDNIVFDTDTSYIQYLLFTTGTRSFNLGKSINGDKFGFFSSGAGTPDPDPHFILDRTSGNFRTIVYGSLGVNTIDLTYRLNVNGSINSTSLYQNGTIIDFTSYATNTAITNTSNYASNISNVLTIRDATNLLNSSNYASNISNILRTAINSISTNNLIFNLPLLNSANTITFNESAVSTLTNFYNKTGSDARYLQLTGGTMTGTIILPNTIWSIKSADNVNRISYATNGASYFHSGNTTGTSFAFKNNADNTEILTISDIGKTIIKGILNIHGGAPYATATYTLQNGSLIIGDTLLNYGGGTNWNAGNAAGLLLECSSSTEIAVHDNGNRLASLMYYEGDGTNKITIGRNMGWTAIANVEINGNLTTTGTATVVNNINISGATNVAQSLYFRSTDYNLGIAGVNGNYTGAALQNDMVLRTLANTNLYLLSGSAGHAIKIDSNNDVFIPNEVGIGTTVPYSTATKLTIRGASSGYSQPLVRIHQTAGWDGNYALEVVGYTNLGGFRINGADTGNSIYQSLLNTNMGFALNPDNTSGNITFITYGAAGNIIFYTGGFIERMRIIPSGNVGIGITDPGSYKLNVNGSINSTSFAQNGTLIDFSSYATNTNSSNYASNISNVLLTNTSNLLYSPNYTIERAYPSKLWTSIDASTTSITYNGLPAFNLNFILNTTGITYGSGAYIITFSNKLILSGTEYPNSFASKLFDYITNTDNVNAADFLNTNIVGFNASGDYIGERYLAETSYKGEWFFLKLPVQILLTKIAVIGNSGFVVRNPALWRIYGSNDGIVWEEIIEGRQSTRLVSTDYSNNSYTINKILSTQSKLYNHIGMNINAIISGQELAFIEFQIFGKEILNYSPIYSTITATNTAITNTSNYASNVSNVLLANMNANFYNKTGSDARYLQLTGGDLTGTLNISYANPILTIKATENQKSILYLSTPYTTLSALKTAIIAEGLGSWGRSKLHFCLNNTGDGLPVPVPNWNDFTNYSASIADARMTILPSGNVGIANANPSQIFQVGNAGRLRISNGTTDYSLLGTIDTDGATNTRIVISGNTRSSGAGNIEYVATSTGSHIFYTTNSTTERMRINSDGLITTSGNIDCGGGLAITGSTSFFNIAGVDAGNLTNTYINFKGAGAGAGNDWCYLRQIGGSEAIKLALDFHDDANDARFCIRSIHSAAAGGTDIVKEVFTVDNDNVITSGNIKAGSFTAGDNTYQLLIGPPTSTTSSSIQTIQQGTGYNQNLTLQAEGGNVGIGTTNPGYKLHIRGSNPTLLRVETANSLANQVSGIEFGIPAFTSAKSAKITSTTADGDVNNLEFYTSSGTTSTVKMSISGTGEMTAQILRLTTVASGNNPLFIRSANTTANNAIQFQNDLNKTVYMGIAGSTFDGLYKDNFYIESANGGIILNTQGRGSSSTPNLLINTDGNIVTSGYIIAGTNGTSSNGLRIGGFDYANTFYMDATTIGGAAANIAFTLRNNNSFVFNSLATTSTELCRINTNGISIFTHLIYNYLFNNTGLIHSSTNDFNAITNFGYRFIQGNINAPNSLSAQWYQWFIGLGIDYPASGANSHGCQFALPRSAANAALYVRFRESNSWGSWVGVAAEALTSGNKSINGILNVSSNIGIGTTNPLADLDIYDVANPKIYLTYGTTSRYFISGTATTFDIGNDIGGARNIRFMPNNTTSVTINSSGISMSGNTVISGASNISTNFLNCCDSNIGATLAIRNFNLIGDAAVMRIWRNHTTNNPSLEFISGATTSAASYTWYWDNYIGASSGVNYYAIRDRMNANAIRLYIDNSGFVGIGITSTSLVARLHVASGTASTGTTQYRLWSFNTGAISVASTTAVTNVCAIFESSIWCRNAGSYIASSDIRIKTNIKDIEDDGALQKILLIQPKTYQYIDKVERGNNTVYGFIAQQIKEIIPEAVSIQKCVIPNIYSFYDCSSNIINMTSNIEKIKLNDTISIYEENIDKKDYTVTEIIPELNQIKINENLLSSNCFVYGSIVDDFHTLDKNYIFTLNVCATQELYRLIQQQQQQIIDLQNQINIIKSQLAAN